MSITSNPSEEELCLVDSCTTNSIHREIKYFQTLKKKEVNIMTINGKEIVRVGSGRATITLPMGTQITIEDALLYPNSTRTLLSFRDIRKNGLHVETHVDSNKEYLLLTKLTSYGKQICEKFSSLQTGLYYTFIKTVPQVTYKIIFQDVDTFRNWHDRLGNPGIGMMRKIINNSIGHDMAKAKFRKNKDFCCTTCATGKLIVRPSYLKI
jgi:hypothetical protein